MQGGMPSPSESVSHHFRLVLFLLILTLALLAFEGHSSLESFGRRLLPFGSERSKGLVMESPEECCKEGGTARKPFCQLSLQLPERSQERQAVVALLLGRAEAGSL